MKYRRLTFILIVVTLIVGSMIGMINTKKQREHESKPKINASFSSVETVKPETFAENIYAFGNYLVRGNIFVNGEDVDWVKNTEWHPGEMLGTVRKNPYSYEEFNSILSKFGQSVSISDFNSKSDLPIETEIYWVKSSSNYPIKYYLYSGTILLAKVGDNYIPYRVYYDNK